MIPHEIAKQLADAIQAADIDPTSQTHLMVDVLMDTVSVKDIVAAAQKAGDYCCQDGCGGGACESCACCVAGWCVSGFDGVPKPGTPSNPADDLDHAAELFRGWLEAAAEKNPVAKTLAEALDQLLPPKDTRDELTVDRAPDTLVGRLFPQLRPVAYGRELSALVTGLYELVTRRALPAERLDISSIRFELRESPILDGAHVFRASARLNPPDAD